MWVFIRLVEINLSDVKDQIYIFTVCPGSSDPPEKILNIFTSENEVYTIYQLLRYFRLNIIRLQSKISLGHMNSIG